MLPISCNTFRRWRWLSVLGFCLQSTLGHGMDLVELIAKVKPSVVRIDTVEQAGRGTGSGVVIDERGIILTNFHVIDGAKEVIVTLGSQAEQQLKGMGYLAIDPGHDLAIIKAIGVDKSNVMPLAAEMPSVGEHVAAFGNPQGFSFTASDGIVSAVRKGTEIVNIVGREAYARLGYHADATWVQTTAPISPGNSGGPLVTMKGELIGLNTWNRKDGQNLNFAISLIDIKRILSQSDLASTPRRFADMPIARAVPMPVQPGQPSRPSDFKLELPTGRVFSYAVFDVSADEIRQASNVDRNDQVLIRHPNGSMYAAASQQAGQLHGLTIGQYENKELMVQVTYAKGRRHGIMKTWSESGKPLLYAQYNQGKKNGFACWHDDGSLQLLLQYKNDTPEWVQLMAGEKSLEGFPSRELADKNETAKAALLKLDAFEANIKKNEQSFRKQVAEFEKARRQAIASKLNPDRRQRASARGAERAAAEQAFQDALWRRAALGR